MADEWYLNGKAMHKARVAKGMSLQRLADELGTSLWLVSSYEQGRTRPHPQRLLQIAEALGLTTEDLMADEPSGRDPYWPAPPYKRRKVKK